ncbi:hypothetical protein [Nocardia sp. alder85J]|uniref:hypothetical protein n=1 Tax=Nocardia sp. alder85J TaxID=2862949 RepID=UPI001CD46067|nr:hypothetical protein [Nocardia sp. alder85J]MCX4093781.1 hypothetical protein [Nocardia sp. alder85J]
MIGEAHRWVPTAEDDMVELQDLVSERGVQIVRPDEEELPGDVITEVEDLVFRWANLNTQDEAEAELDEWEPVDVLLAMSWMCALWAVVCETRLGKPADAIVHDLDYRGGWRRLHNIEEERLWEGLTERMRLGAMAALTEDPRAVAAYREAYSDPPDIAEILVRHTLIHLDALSQDMQLHDLPARGLAAGVIANTRPGSGPRRRLCFRPSHPL